MDFSTLKNISPVYPMYISQFKDIISDPNSDIQTKINSIIDNLNAYGATSNQLVNNWNQVMQWALNDGLNSAVITQMNAIVANGTFQTTLDNIVSKEGDLTQLTTTNKTDLVHAINENVTNITTNTTQLEDNVTNFIVNLNDRKYGLVLDGVTDDSTAFQNALNLTLNGQTNPLSKTVVLPTKDIKITKTIHIPVGVNVIGLANARIVADYSAWTGGTDYRAVHVMTREGVSYNGKEYHQRIEGFKIVGKNNASVQSIGLDLSTPSSITWEQAVNYSVILAQFQNLYIDGFDTALNVIECHDSIFHGITIMNSRVGIWIVGKAVNLRFNQITAEGFTKSNTSSTGLRIGIMVDSKMSYTDGEGRPEGITIENSLIYGADNDLVVNRVLFMRVLDCVIDGAYQDCVQILNPDDLTIENCYIFTSGAYCGVNLESIGTAHTQIRINDNYIVGNNVSGSYGIYSNNTRTGVKIAGNHLYGFPNPIWVNYLNYSVIKDNYGYGNSGSFIFCQSGMYGTEIDGNTSDDSQPILMLQPSTDKSLKIGSNKSQSTQTYYQGNVSMAASGTSIVAPNNMYNSELYIRTITRVMPTGNLGGVWVQPDTNWSQATINCSTAPTSATKIYYECVAIPYSATQ